MTRPRLIQACKAMLWRDLTLAWRRRGDIVMPLLYALLVTMLFPFALGPEDTLLQRIAGGVVLVTVLLAMLLTLDAMFASDIEDGSLEQLVLSPQPLALLLGMKMLAHWLTTALPLIVIAPLLAAMLHLPNAVIPVLLLALLLATPLLSLLGGVLVALTALWYAAGLDVAAVMHAGGDLRRRCRGGRPTGTSVARANRLARSCVGAGRRTRATSLCRRASYRLGRMRT